MSSRRLKKWPGKKVHRGKWNRIDSWSGKLDTEEERTADEIKEYFNVEPAGII